MTIQKKDTEIQKIENNLEQTTDKLYENNYLYAGVKVRDVAGGPEMVIVGFVSELKVDPYSTMEVLPEKIFLRSNNHSNVQIVWLFQKVFYNRDSLPTHHFIGQDRYEKDVKGWKFIPDIISYFYLINNQVIKDWLPWGHGNHFSNELIALCKYWSNKDEEMKYVFKTHRDLELV
jgi:hypothetical protein